MGAKKTHLWAEDTVEADGMIIVRATIEVPKKDRISLWYRIPSEYKLSISGNSDPFVIGVLFLTMAEGTDIKVHGEVSPSLLFNLEEFQAAWTCWRPNKYSKIEICADVEREQPLANNSDSAIAAFSGGVDSCFTVWRHHKKASGRSKSHVNSGLMIHGFDILLNEKEAFTRAAKKSAKMLRSLGLTLIPVATNFRELDQDWIDSHGAGLASCLMLFQGAYVSGLIASSSPYNALSLPWGSNPLTDWMFSSDSFKIIHDGASFIRREKIREITKWPEAMKFLRVCWEGENYERNCGRCEKCVRTILSFRVMGYGLPECFDQDISDDVILALNGLRGNRLYYLEEILSFARASHIKESWVYALETCVKRNRLLSSERPKSIGQRLRKKLAFRKRLSMLKSEGWAFFKNKT